MQTWLSDRGQVVPDAKATKMKMMMNGIEHDMLMAGMLTDEEMAALDKARGPEWDRLFLDRHDQAPPGRNRHGGRAVQVVRRGAGRDGVQVRERRVRRPVDGDRSDAEDARRRECRGHETCCKPRNFARPRSRCSIATACGPKSTSAPPAAPPAAAPAPAPARPPATPPPAARRARDSAALRRTAAGAPAAAAAAPTPPPAGRRRPRHAAATTAAAAGRDAAAGDADRLDDRAVTRSARRPQGRPLGRGPGRVEHEDDVDDAAEREVARRDALGSRVHAASTHSGQLQRLRDLRHLESREARAR